MARVLIIAYTTLVHDGRVKRHAEALAARGDSVDVICLSSGHDGPQHGVNVIGIRMPRYRGASQASYIGSYLRFFVRAALLTYRLSRVQPYHLVIACTMPDTAVFAALPARLFGSRVILDIHDTMPELYQDKFGGRRGTLGARLLMTMEYVCASFADRVFAVHRLHRWRLEQTGIPASKISVVMNSPQPSIFEVTRRPAAMDRTGFSLVCHGTITRRLGIDVAIEAISLLVDRIPELRLRVIGAGDYSEDAKALAERLGVSSRVSFEGLMPIEELPRVLRATDIGLVPNHDSNATRLMLPVKLLEYAILGIPVIASRLRTVEYYFPENAIRLVPPGDSNALATAIEELYQHPARRQALTQRARQVAEELSWARQEKNLFLVIDSLLGSRPGFGNATEQVRTMMDRA